MEFFLLNIKNPVKNFTKENLLPLVNFPKNELFRPHGISFYKSKNGKFLYVVNHREDNDTIEFFQFKDKKLYYVESYSDPLFTSLNNVVGIDERKFYVTNDHLVGHHSKMYIPETVLSGGFGVGFGSVVYYDQSQPIKFTTKASFIPYANGIESSADRSKIYVSEFSARGGMIKVFSRNFTNGDLTLLEDIPVLTPSPDNINRDEDGNLWIGAGARTLSSTIHFYDPIVNKAPFQVIKIAFDKNGNHVVTEEFLSLGDPSVASVASRFKEYLLIGFVCDKGLLHCVQKKKK